MVSNLSFVAMGITLLLVFGFPIGLAVWFAIRKKISGWAIFVGLLGFLVSQVLIRIPLLGLLSRTEFYGWMLATPIILAVFLSFTAGLFEETGRWLGFKFLLRKQLEHKNAIAYGIGHGGFEAIFLVGMAYINNIVISLMINTGRFDSTIAPMLDSATAEYVRSQLVSTPSYQFLLGGVERIFAMILQIAMSVLVYYAVRYRKPGFYWLSILVHTFINLPSVMLARLPSGILWSEVFLLACTIAAIIFLKKSQKLDQNLLEMEQNKVGIVNDEGIPEG